MESEQRFRDESLGRVAIRVRSDLRCQLQEIGGKPFFLVEDLVRGQFFRLGAREWSLASRLDGQRPVREVVQEHVSAETGQPLSVAEAKTFILWLVQNQLAQAVVPEVNQVGPVSHRILSRPADRMSALTGISPFFIRIPLGNPDRLLTRLAPSFRWLVSPWTFLIWAATCALGVYRLAGNWTTFVDSASRVFAPNNWVYLILVWLLLKVVHEFSHGIYCKIYGGTVPSAGIALILLSPMAFVDVTSSWRFRRRRQRIMTAWAGIHVELFVAAVAAILWHHLQPGMARQACQNLIFTASFTTVLFNANPLMRFDGYYILGDLVGIQNLYSLGQQFVSAIFRRFYLGIETPLRLDAGWRGLFIRVYGVASMFWRILVVVGLATVAATMFHGAGIILTILAVVGWVSHSIGRLRQRARNRHSASPIDRRRLAVAVLATVGGLSGLALIPWPSGVSAPAVVEYEPRTRIRVESAGFVQQVCVRAGDRIEPGTRLVLLENEESEMRLRELQSRIEQSRIKSTMFHRDLRLAEKQAEDQKRSALAKQRDQLLEIRNGLVINAPTAGVVVGRNLETWQGRYAEVGTVLMDIGDPSKKQLRVAVAQEDHEQFAANIASAVWVRLRGHSRRVRGTNLMGIDPKASVHLSHVALSSTSGGPLTVTPRNQLDDAFAQTDASQYQLVSPRFTATVSLPEDESLRSYTGQLANVRVFSARESIAQRLLRVSERWLDSKLGRSR